MQHGGGDGESHGFVGVWMGRKFGPNWILRKEAIVNAIVAIPRASTRVAPPQVQDKGGFLNHVHLARGIAILLVMGAHCWPAFAWSDSERARVLLPFDNVTVVFMFISGLLFQHLSHKFAYRRYLRHRFASVVLPYLVTSIPAIILVIFMVHRSSVWPWVYEMPVWEQVLFFIATGKHLAPLWFIPMMTLFIIAAPVFVWLGRIDAYRWAVPITLVIAIVVGRDCVPGVFNNLGKAVFMLPAYLAGMGFSHHRLALESWCERRIGWLILSFGVASWVMLVNPAHADFSLVQKLIMAAILIVMTKRLAMPEWLDRATSHIAKLSFALYFIHGYVITTLRTAAEKTGFALPDADQTGAIFSPSLLGLLLFVAAVAAITIAIAELGRRLLGRFSRMLIGA